VDEDRIYAVTARGELVCLKSTDGKELWRKNYPQDFEGKSGAWGFCDRPLVDGDRLICTPGGATATVVALDKKSGAVVWRCAVPGGIRCGYAATVVATIGTLRHYVAFLHGAVVGVSARDGKLLWRYDSIANLTGNNYSPIIRGDHVFCASGYGKGIALLKLIPDKDGLRVEEVYFVRMPLPPWHETTVLVNDHVYLGSTRGMSCVELATGKVVWEARGAVGGTVSVTCADGRLYLRAPDGKVALVEASPKEYLLKGIFNIPGARPKPGSTAPVVAAGRLYLRDDDGLFCYDVKEGATAKAGVPAGQVSPKPVPRPREERGGQDVFVPTPQDVVERMLELARVKRNDVVYDLGCGDGRIVVTAARKYGCKAVGYDIDPECVKTARERVAQADMGRLVAIEQKDFFTADIGKADVVTLYLLPRTMERLVPQLNKLRPGSRIVSHAAAIPGYRPEQVVTIKSSDDNVEHRIYLWTVPLKKDGPEK
jgi:outer membrane protein assembly factor BamB/protein-L-isoaspartate O-methyltransferase